MAYLYDKIYINRRDFCKLSYVNCNTIMKSNQKSCMYEYRLVLF